MGGVGENRGRGRGLLAVGMTAAALLAAAWPPAPAAAQHSQIALESTGPQGGNGAQAAELAGIDAAATRAYLRTAEPLTAGDSDSALDVYEHTGPVTTLVSAGPQAGSGTAPASFGGVAGQNTVFIQTSERLLAEDTDDYIDVYRRDASGVTRSSFGSAGGNGAHDAYLAGVAADSGDVVFTTRERLLAADTDSSLDVYARSGDQVTLVSTGPAGGNGTPGVTFLQATADGAHVFFATTESLVAADTDSVQDVYERSGGATTLVSTGPNGGNAEVGASFSAASADGAHVFFATTESLVAADTDDTVDVYERSGGTTTIHSIGPSGGNGRQGADFAGISPTGSHVFFETPEALDTAADRDSAIDVYESTGGTVRLVTPGTRSGATAAYFAGTSADGARVLFQTDERVLAADTDGYQDVYMREAGAYTLVSTGPAGGGAAVPAHYAGVSEDGAHVFFETIEPLVSADTDGRIDVYEREAGGTTLVSTGPTGGSGPADARFRAASPDGKRVFFRTAEALVPTDTDAAQDVYSANVPGTLTVRLDATPDDSQDFTFSAGGLTPPAFQLDDDLDPALANARVFTDVTPGTGYTVSQAAPPGWFLAGATCDDGSPVTDIDVAPGEQVTCTFLDARTYQRPGSAAQERASLVVAFDECLAANRVHGPPFDRPACNPPAPASDFLTVGPGMTGTFRLSTRTGDPGVPGDQADVGIHVSIHDVLRATTRDDYPGQLEGRVSLRVTDRLNGPGQNEPGTSTDLPFAFAVPCTGTPGAAGATCAVGTTADAVLAGAVVEGKRAIWSTASIDVRDGGADGTAATQDNTPFLRQGIFVP